MTKQKTTSMRPPFDWPALYARASAVISDLEALASDVDEWGEHVGMMLGSDGCTVEEVTASCIVSACTEDWRLLEALPPAVDLIRRTPRAIEILENAATFCLWAVPKKNAEEHRAMFAALVCKAVERDLDDLRTGRMDW